MRSDAQKVPCPDCGEPTKAYSTAGFKQWRRCHAGHKNVFLKSATASRDWRDVPVQHMFLKPSREIRAPKLCPCGKRVNAAGYCATHYSRFKKYGDPQLDKPIYYPTDFCKQCGGTEFNYYEGRSRVCKRQHLHKKAKNEAPANSVEGSSPERPPAEKSSGNSD